MACIFTRMLAVGYPVPCVRPKSVSTVKTPPPISKQAAEALPELGYLVVIYGPDMGKRVPIGSDPIEIGRADDCGLTIEQESVSRRHSLVTFVDGAHFIEDLGSTNGTIVNEITVKKVPLRSGDRLKIGRTIIKYMAGNDIEARYHEEIYLLMMTDALTQAYNHRYFEEAAEREVARSLRYGRPLSLVLFDIDHFKDVNDRFGHLAGDSALRLLALTIKPCIREHDIFARTGGEEFGLILPEVTLANARVVAEKLRLVVGQGRFLVNGGEITMTMSAGCAEISEKIRSHEALYQAADKALYMAKNEGRNCVRG